MILANIYNGRIKDLYISLLKYLHITSESHRRFMMSLRGLVGFQCLVHHLGHADDTFLLQCTSNKLETDRETVE